MALVVEDGSIVAGANSYADLATIRAYSVARGTDLSGVADAALEASALQAMDYLEGADQVRRYQGDRVSSDQTLAFPRNDVIVDGFYLSSTAIPSYLVNAQCALTMEIHSGGDPLPNQTGGEVIREKVGDLEVQYSDKGHVSQFTPAFAKVEALLSHLYRNNGLELVRA